MQCYCMTSRFWYFLRVPLLLGIGVLIVVLGASCEPSGTPDVVPDEDGRMRVGPAEATTTTSRAVVSGDRRLVIDAFRGTVLLEGTPAETAELRFIKRGLGATDEEARENLGEVQITEQGTDTEYTFSVESGAEDRSAVDIQGAVPEAVPLRLDRSSGAVSLLDVRGPIRVRHQHGTVDIRGAAGDVDIAIQNGDITVHMQSVPPDASVDLSTANGDLTLALPPGASVQIDAQTSVGEVFVRGLTFDPQRLTPLSAGARYTAQNGAGDAVITLRTENGSIVLQDHRSPLPDGATPSDTTAVDPTATDTATTDTTAVPSDPTPSEPATSDPQNSGDTPSGDADSENASGAQLGPTDTSMPAPDSLDAPLSTPPDTALPDTVGAGGR
jgi:hypothetical protein